MTAKRQSQREIAHGAYAGVAACQALLGAGSAALGFLGITEGGWHPFGDLSSFIYGLYVVLGLTAIGLALPLAFGRAWPRPAIPPLVVLFVGLPILDMLSVKATTGGLHGSEGSTLLLLLALPLCVAMWRGR